MSFQTSLLSLLLAIFTEEFAIRGTHSVYVAIAGEVVNRRSVLLKEFVLNGKVSTSNPLLHIHANRYRQA